MSKREHWKRHEVAGGYVYALIVVARSERWCAKLVLSAASDGAIPSVCRIWRGTTIVHESTGLTKQGARAMLDALIEVAALAGSQGVASTRSRVEPLGAGVRTRGR